MADLTDLATWSVVSTPPGVTCSIDPVTGRPQVTAISVAEATIRVAADYGDIHEEADCLVQRQDDPPSSAGSPGTTSGSSASTSALGSTTGTAYDTANAVSSILRATAGAAGKVQCTAPISFRRTPGTAAGETGAYGKWQWRTVGGTFADVAAEVVSNSNATTIVNAGDPTMNRSGGLSVTMTKTGLTAGTDYEFRFLWRRVDVSDTANNIYIQSGTMIADGTVS